MFRHNGNGAEPDGPSGVGACNCCFVRFIDKFGMFAFRVVTATNKNIPKRPWRNTRFAPHAGQTCPSRTLTICPSAEDFRGQRT